MKKCSIYAALLLLISAHQTLAERGFMLTAPSQIHVGHREKMCISFHGFGDDSRERFQVELSLSEKNSPRTRIDTVTHSDLGFSQCFDYTVPTAFSRFNDRTVFTLTARGRARNSDYAFENQKDVYIRKPELITFIQTDKPKYKPGQTVKLRVLSVNDRLIPQLSNFSLIEITDPNDITIMQWSNLPVADKQGIADLELPLSDEPTLGRWAVKVTNVKGARQETGHFSIEEYVLPKYEISVKTKSYVPVNAQKIDGEICAMYTYGEPVRGSLNARFCIVTYSSWNRNVRPCVYMNVSEVEGCHPFSVSTSELQLANSTYPIWNAHLEVFAEITESGTGVVLNHTHDKVEVTRKIFDLKFLESPTYFKPGLPYYGRLSVRYPDGMPATGERVTVEFHDYTHNKHFTKMTTSGDDGLVSFNLPALDVDISRLSLQAKMPDYQYKYDQYVYLPYDTTAYHSLKQWYSPTNSYVQIEPIEGAVPCDRDVTFNISHTVEEGGVVDLFYQVVSRGNVMHQGKLVSTFAGGVLARPDQSFQIEECPEGQQFSTCISARRTCDNLDTPLHELYGHPCERGCMCPWPTNVLHQGRCITQFDCPNYDGGDSNETRPECPHDQVWNGCSSPCVKTCEDKDRVRPCIEMCVAQCECPPSAPFLHERRCVRRNQCPKKKTPDRSEIRSMVSLPLRVRVNAGLSPNMKLLVYYVRTDGETIADSLAVRVQQCTHNKVEIKFADGEKYPGASTTLKIKADAESLCSVGVVDKSVHILGGKNRLTLDQVMTEVEQYELGEYSFVEAENEYCRRVIEEEVRKATGRRNRNRPPRVRQPRDIIWPGRYISNYFDSMKAFRSTGLLIISDHSIDSRPCTESYLEMYSSVPGEPDRVAYMPAPLAPQGIPDIEAISEDAGEEPEAETFKPAVDIRTYFPETWLWDLQFIDRAGEQDVSVTLPHTITSWVGGGFCTNLNSGLGVSAPTTIKGFQPFFVSITLPYSVIRNEKINLPVTVFNYLSDCLNVQLTVDQSADLDIEGSTSKQACVCGQESSTQYFRIAPKKLGDVNITIRAESIDNNGICGNRIFATDQVGVRDAVVRTMLVEPEGEPQEYSKTSFICPEQGKMHVEEMTLVLPNNTVPDTPKAMVKVIGDLMGPALDDIDKLLAMPYGCGEQNMLKFAPNIFVMQYLDSVNEVTEAIAEKSNEYLQQGYQRELTYRHTDGSYSAFGNNDASGSMWLTAFVLKSFAQASPLIYIDKANLKMSIDWVLDQQLENGCFPKVGRVLHKGMKGGLSGDHQSPATLTAYVLIALLEAKPYTPIPARAINEALLCIDSFSSSADTYTRALIAYAHSLHDVTSAARSRAMAAMESRATTEGDNKYWSAGPSHQSSSPSRYYGDNNAKAMDIEITAYMLLAYTVAGANNSIDNGLPLVFWLSKQRSPGGGFSSTQDTVIALQALARYAARAHTDGMDMQVKVNGTGMEHVFTINNDNKMVMQKMAVRMPNSLMVQANGSGCAFVQTSVHYHVMDIPVTAPAFTLTVETKRVSSTDGCQRREIKVCARYLLSDGYSNMAVISVKMVSGWIPDKETIKNLMNSVEVNLKKYEIEPNLVNFYFDEITSKSMCLSFHVEQNVEVDEAKPGYAEVYDYYEKELRITKPYTIRNTCGTKEELPDLTVDQYNAIRRQDEKDPSGIEQRRLPAVLPGGNGDGGLGDSDEVVEPLIVPVVVVPLGGVDRGGAGTPAPVIQCPHCYDEIVSGSRFNTLFCNSHYVYKAAVKNGRYAAKVMADVRPTAGKQRVDVLTNFVMNEGCQCSTITGAQRNSKILILQGDDHAINSTAHSLKLTAGSHVMPITDDADNVRAARCTP